MQVFLAPYGADFTAEFELFEVDGVDLRADAVHASGDVTVYEDQAAAATADNGFTDEGVVYSLVCSAAELTGKRATYAIVDQTGTKVWLDKVFTVETYGHPLSMHPHIGVPGYELAGAGAPQAVDATTVTLPTGADNTDNDSYNAVVMVESGLPPLVAYGSYVASTRVFTFDPAPGLTFTTAAWVGPMKLPGATVATGVTLAASQPLYAPATASALATVDSNVDSILTDTGTTLPGTLSTIDGNVDAILVDTGTTLPATLATIDGNVDSILVDTGTTIPGTISTAQTDLDTITGSDGVTLATAQGNYAPATAGDEMDLVDAPNATAIAAWITAIAGSALFTGITSLAQWLGAMAGKQTPNATAQTELRATGAGSGAYDATTDSQEAILDTGAADWVTGAGGSAPTAAAIADAVLDEALSGHTTAGTLGKAIADTETDVAAIETRLPDALESGRMSAVIGSASTAAVRDAILDRATSSHTTAGTVGAAIGDTVEDTGTTIPGLISALNDLADADVMPASGEAFTVLFKMVDATDGYTAETGLTVSAVVDTDDGGFATADNSVTEVGVGWYSLVLSASEMTGARIIMQGTASGARAADVVIYTTGAV